MTKGVIIIFVGITILVVCLNIAAHLIGSQPPPKNERFVVVDTYKGCDVVRYSPTLSANYSYFLDCK